MKRRKWRGAAKLLMRGTQPLVAHWRITTPKWLMNMKSKALFYSNWQQFEHINKQLSLLRTFLSTCTNFELIKCGFLICTEPGCMIFKNLCIISIYYINGDWPHSPLVAISWHTDVQTKIILPCNPGSFWRQISVSSTCTYVSWNN